MNEYQWFVKTNPAIDLFVRPRTVAIGKTNVRRNISDLKLTLPRSTTASAFQALCIPLQTDEAFILYLVYTL